MQNSAKFAKILFFQEGISVRTFKYVSLFLFVFAALLSLSENMLVFADESEDELSKFKPQATDIPVGSKFTVNHTIPYSGQGEAGYFKHGDKITRAENITYIEDEVSYVSGFCELIYDQDRSPVNFRKGDILVKLKKKRVFFRPGMEKRKCTILYSIWVGL